MGHWTGSCHCGAVRFEVTTDVREITACDCSLCRRKNARMIQVHESGLTVTAGQNSLSEYRWNKGVARHFFCRACGIYPFHRKRSAPDSYGVNIFCLNDFEPDAYPVRQADGATMTVEPAGARAEWRGPRV